MNLWEENDDFLARWLNDDLSPEEKAEFENSDEGKAYAQMIQAADRLTVPPYDVNAGLAQFKGRIREASAVKETKTVWMQPIFRYAVAACVTAIVVTAYFLLQSPLTKVNTAPGQQEIVMLPDGSEVKMNGTSTLSFNEKTWAENRAVNISGEAFFEVKKGSSFVVNTDFGSVTVLGTSFNVKTRNQKLEVVCYTGKVNVASTNTDHDLLPGDGVRVEQGTITSSWKKDTDTSGPSWLNGLTVFEGEVPLREAVDELVNVFGIEVLEFNVADTIKYDGGFPHADASNAVSLVLGTLKLEYEFDSTKNTLRILGINP
ncbi:MAG: hypothetical protein HEP71_09410 [Roseivirga sp.]|nr:hypothetical protein [Roseivirga sp.]